jgi:uncharacterized membrane protein YtjA (UPF0391 family)
MSLLKWALIFAIIAGIAAIFGFGNVAEGASDIAKILFFLFLVICAVLATLGLTVYRTVAGGPQP